MRIHALWLPCSLTGALMVGPVSAGESDFQTAKYFWGVQFDELEYRYSEDDDQLAAWDGSAFYGTDELKFRWRTKGEYGLDEGSLEKLENHFLVQTPISDFFDAKAGVRVDTPEGPDRTYGVIGISGLAPYWFEVDADVYVSDQGDASTEFDAEYELLLNRNLTLTLSLDATVAFSEDREIGVGTGLNSTEFGARLSYDVIDRLFSPYIGVVKERLYGDTRDLAGDRSADTWFAVIGTRLVF